MPARLPPPPAVNTPPRTFTERDYGHDVYHGYVNSIRHATTSDLWNGSKAYELGILIGAHLILFNSRDDNWDMSSDGLSHFFRMFYYKRPRHQPRLDRENVNRPAYHFIGKELRTVFPRDPFRDELVSNPLFLSSLSINPSTEINPQSTLQMALGNKRKSKHTPNKADGYYRTIGPWIRVDIHGERWLQHGLPVISSPGRDWRHCWDHQSAHILNLANALSEGIDNILTHWLSIMKGLLKFSTVRILFPLPTNIASNTHIFLQIGSRRIRVV